jgi:hypothetical protein
MKNFHLNNNSKSKQDINKLASKILTAIFEENDGMIILSVDDGDGDVWKYQIHVDCDHVPAIRQIDEN